MYNEPRGPGEDFVFGLRNAAYQWIKALQPTNPVISCWDDNNDTDSVNHHEYIQILRRGSFQSCTQTSARVQSLLKEAVAGTKDRSAAEEIMEVRSLY